ncbi:MAG: Rieske (2Fe-2S) protein, partial [Candidatus Thermofonsia bacterium]
AALNLPATEPVPTYQTKVEDGYLFVEKPESW